MKHQDIANLLPVSPSFISKWCLIDEEPGALALLLNYQGKLGYLSDNEKPEVILFLQQYSHFSQVGCILCTTKNVECGNDIKCETNN